MRSIRPGTIADLFRRSHAERWDVSAKAFEEALETSASKAFAGRTAGASEVERFFESLHLEDLALACACGAGNERAWEHFMREQRPLLYRSAQAIDPTGGARELADSLYADLYGVSDREGSRRPLFRYFHGRSSLATWLRAVLAQRHVDRLRAARRLEPLPEDDSGAAVVAPTAAPEPDRLRHARALECALAFALSRVAVRDRLRLGCYYAQEMTLAEIGRLLREHEATVSRHLARTRRSLRDDIERHMLSEAGLSELEVEECFRAAVADSGALDLSALLASAGERKESGPDRSKSKRVE